MAAAPASTASCATTATVPSTGAPLPAAAVVRLIQFAMDAQPVYVPSSPHSRPWRTPLHRATSSCAPRAVRIATSSPASITMKIARGSQFGSTKVTASSQRENPANTTDRGPASRSVSGVGRATDQTAQARDRASISPQIAKAYPAGTIGGSPVRSAWVKELSRIAGTSGVTICSSASASRSQARAVVLGMFSP